ncbi:hypothetical protein DM558_07580 [Entomomonas moraniae]|uniref:Uncharacterized protein n=1 Tax=Entomomonas moraniae TaxID=2213226 RepID=A0A3Q9JIV7_9GAMM|nr:hypothetical protein [Entomomonas moraniae]AZS50647.1 hypothetical protein DM558_07580 [Entomomonas moraniae]
METNKLFSLQGRFSTIQRKADGSLDNTTKTWLGNVKEASIEMSVDKETMKESFSGQRADYGTIITGKTFSLNMTLTEWLPEPLALSLYAKEVKVDAKTIADEEFPTVVDGNTVVLDGYFISDLIIKDSTATPVTLKEGVDYEIVSDISGDIKILNTKTFKQPFKASYKSSEATALYPFANIQPPERCLVFEGINTLTGKNTYIEMYRVQFDPTSNFGLINETFGELPLTGTLLIDSQKTGKDQLSGYMQVLTME